MQDTEFTEDSQGRLVRTIKGASAFVPAPLPPGLPTLDLETTHLLAEAENSLGRLVGAGKALNPHLVSQPLLRREAIVSSRMEGTVATAEQVAALEAAQGRLFEPPDVAAKEVLNYVIAMNRAVRRLKSLPISLRLIREMHASLMKGVRGETDRPGEFRQAQNYIANHPGDPIEKARFVPPPVVEMNAAMSDLEKYINGDDKLPVLVQAALIHYQFETIHPFRDGNGRVGRLLIPLHLLSVGKLESPLLYFSSFFEQEKSSYVDLMLNVSKTGDWASWIKFFLRATVACSQESLERAEKLQALRDSYRLTFQKARSSVLLHTLIDQLFEYPVVTIGMAAEHLSITPAAASHNIRKLVEAGILAPIPGTSQPRRYRAQGVLRLVRG